MDKDKIKRLADYIISECTQHSKGKKWSITYKELEHHFGADISDSHQNGKLLEEELRQREEINELIMTEDCIEMTCHLEYCEQCHGNPLSLLSVVGCNIYNEHEHESVEHSDEEASQVLSV